MAPGRGDVALGAVNVVHIEDGGRTSGVPGLLRADAGGVFGALLPAPVTRPGLAFGPVAALDGSGLSVLLYQEKPVPKAFSRVAPISAVTAARAGDLGARQILDSRLAGFPAVRIYGSGAIAAWEAPGHRWGVAVERGGRFTVVAAPAGGPSMVGEDFIFNRDLDTAGRCAALTWTALDGSARVSLGVL